MTAKGCHRSRRNAVCCVPGGCSPTCWSPSSNPSSLHTAHLGWAGLPLPACAQPWPLRLKEMEKKGEVSGLSETGKTEEVRRSTLQYKKCQFLQRLGGALPEGQVRGAELPHWLCSQADLALSPRLISSSAVTLDKSFYSLGCHFTFLMVYFSAVFYSDEVQFIFLKFCCLCFCWYCI